MLCLMLLILGASVEIRNHLGFTPLSLAAHRGAEENLIIMSLWKNKFNSKQISSYIVQFRKYKLNQISRQEFVHFKNIFFGNKNPV